MRKYIVTGFYLLILGALITMGGYMMNGAQRVVWNHGFKVSKFIQKTETTKKFSKVRIDGRNVGVQIEKGDKYQVHVSGDKVQLPKYNVRNGVLNITGNGKRVSISDNQEKIVVTVPDNVKLDKVHVASVDSSIKIQNITLKKLSKSSQYLDDEATISLDNVTVDNAENMFMHDDYIKINNSTINKLHLQNGDDSAAVISNSTLNDYQISTDGANVRIENSHLNKGDSFISDGHLVINNTEILGVNDFNLTNESHITTQGLQVKGYDLSTNTGSINYLGTNYSKSSYQTNTDAADILRIKSTNGSINIK